MIKKCSKIFIILFIFSQRLFAQTVGEVMPLRSPGVSL